MLYYLPYIQNATVKSRPIMRQLNYNIFNDGIRSEMLFAKNVKGKRLKRVHGVGDASIYVVKNIITLNSRKIVQLSDTSGNDYELTLSNMINNSLWTELSSCNTKQ